MMIAYFWNATDSIESVSMAGVELYRCSHSIPPAMAPGHLDGVRRTPRCRVAAVNEDAERIRFLDAFGALIANTDRHFGNVSLFDHHKGIFELAPVYDMLPMLFAPQMASLWCGNSIQYRQGRPGWLFWAGACKLAEIYWDRVAQEPRVSADFHKLSAQSLSVLRAMPRRRAPVSAH